MSESESNDGPDATTSYVQVGVSPQERKRPRKGSVKSIKRGSKYQTKSALKGLCKIPKYQIPESKLHAALEILEAEGNQWVAPTWEDGCHHQPHIGRLRTCGFKRNSFSKLIAECRVCLLNRDWINLSAILAIAKPITDHDYKYYMPYFLKYAAICLIHNSDGDALDNFLYGVIGCENDHEKKVFLQSLSSFYVSRKDLGEN